MAASTSSTARMARARRRRERSESGRRMLPPLRDGGPDLVEGLKGAGALGLAQRAVAEPRQLEESGQGLGGPSRKAKTRQRLAQELHRGEPRPPRQPAVGGDPLEPRVAADDGAASVRLGAEILHALRHRLSQRGRRLLGRGCRPPLGQAVAEGEPYGERKGADAGEEGENAERPGDEGRGVRYRLGDEGPEARRAA